VTNQDRAQPLVAPDATDTDLPSAGGVDVAGVLPRVDEELVTALATATDLAAQNTQLYEQEQHRQQWLETSRDIMATLSSGSTPVDVFPRLVSCVRELARADTAFLTLRLGDGTERAEIADGVGAEQIKGVVLPEQSTPADPVDDRHPIVVVDSPEDRGDWQLAVDTAGGGPALFVRFANAQTQLGTLVVSNRLGGPSFPAETVSLVESLAAQAAVALRLGAAASDREAIAVLGERDRIARDLHDVVIRRLFTTGMALESALRTMQAGPTVTRVQQAIDEIDQTIKEIRTTIFALQSSIAPPREHGAINIR
jgi:signal transduction histidine kinase